MDDAWLGLTVAVLVLLALVAALVHDLRGRRPADARDVDDQALRRARELDAHHQSPGPPAGTTFP